MLDKTITKIKIYFFILGLVLVGVIGGGSIYLSGYDIIDPAKIESAITYAAYKLDLESGSENELLASASGLFDNTSVYSQQGNKKAASIPVLVYHGVLNKSDGSKLNITKEKFKEQMFALKKAGYATIDTDELYRFLRGEIELPEKSIIISFDDGRVDSYKGADPILKVLNFKAVMFVISEYSLSNDNRNRYYLTPTQLSVMEKTDRWDIQAHTNEGHETYPIDQLGNQGHFFGYKFWLQDQNRIETNDEFNSRTTGDLELVKKEIEQGLNKEVRGFAFPFGDFGQNATNFPDAKNIILNKVSSIYNLAFYQTAPGQRFSANYHTDRDENKNFFLIKRMDIDINWTGEDIIEVMKKGQPKELPYTDNLSENKGWITSWGDVKIDSNLLTLKALSSETGAAVILDGTRKWKNYEIKANVNVPRQNGIYVWARFQDDFNNTACNFGPGFAHIDQTVNGEPRVIKGIRSPEIKIPAGDFDVEVIVNNRDIKCKINGKVLVESPFLEESLDEGGIGFKTWDSELGQSVLQIKNLVVNEI